MATQKFIDEIEDYVGGNIEGIPENEIDRMMFTRFLRRTLTQVEQDTIEKVTKQNNTFEAIHLETWADSIDRENGYPNSQLSCYLRYQANAIRTLKNEAK